MKEMTDRQVQALLALQQHGPLLKADWRDRVMARSGRTLVYSTIRALRLRRAVTNINTMARNGIVHHPYIITERGRDLLKEQLCQPKIKG